MKDHTLRRILIFFLLISIFLVVVAVQAVRNINHSTPNSDWVNHTHAVIMEVEALQTALYVADVCPPRPISPVEPSLSSPSATEHVPRCSNIWT